MSRHVAELGGRRHHRVGRQARRSRVSLKRGVIFPRDEEHPRPRQRVYERREVTQGVRTEVPVAECSDVADDETVGQAEARDQLRIARPRRELREVGAGGDHLDRRIGGHAVAERREPLHASFRE